MKQNLNPLSRICHVSVASFVIVASAASADLASLKAGATKEYEIVQPKIGFVGAPPTSAAMPQNRRVRSEADLDKRFIRVTIVETRRLDEIHRTVFRIDEIDKFHRLTYKGVFFGYLDVFPQGTRMLCKGEDDNGRDRDDGEDVRMGLRFPFNSTRPPALGFSRTGREGYIDVARHGVDYVLKDTGGTNLVIDATYVRNEAASAGPLPRVPRWHAAEMDEVIRTNTNIRVRFREKQEWDRTDWLWKKMERFDEKGNLMMRCTELPQR